MSHTYSKIKPLLFNLDPENAHDLILNLLRVAGLFPLVRDILRRIYTPDTSRPVTFAGLKFPNPVGLAAGYDKDGIAWLGLACLGFGHIELGTVTPLPQVGNPKPRIFRLPEKQGLINRMGFPGRGADSMLKMIPERGSSTDRDAIILGINIGKNKDTPNEEAVLDYLRCIRILASRADYFTVNVSSPNTLGLRKLQGKKYLYNLVKELVSERDRLKIEHDRPLPILVKLSPDLADDELDDALEAIMDGKADGVVASNTTIQRVPHLPLDPDIQGGLSGKPIQDLNSSFIRKINQRTAGGLPIIGVGGINTVADASEKMDAGAALIQLYSGLIYQGPMLVQNLVNNL